MGRESIDLRYTQINKLDQFSIGNSTSSIELSYELLKNIGSAVYFLGDCKQTLWRTPNVCTVVKIYDGKRKLKLRYNDLDSHSLQLDESVLCCNGHKLTDGILLSDVDAERILDFANLL